MGTVTIKKNTESDEFDEFKKVKTERIFIEDIYFDEWISDDKWSTFINLSVIITNRNLVKINPKIYVNVEGDTPSSIIPKTLIEIPPLASKEIIFHDSVLGTSSYSYTLKIMIEDELFYEKTFSD